MSSRTPMSMNFTENYFHEEADYQDWWMAESYDTYSTQHDDGWQDDSWGDDWLESHQVEPAPPPDDPQDKELQDSLQAEKEAEGLAMQAQQKLNVPQQLFVEIEALATHDLPMMVDAFAAVATTLLEIAPTKAFLRARAMVEKGNLRSHGRLGDLRPLLHERERQGQVWQVQECTHV